MKKLLKIIKQLALKYQSVPLIGMILFTVYMILKLTFCITNGYCPII